MTDKERILMAIITRIIPGLLHASAARKEEYCTLFFVNKSMLQPGDLVFENISPLVNDFIVGFVDHYDSDKGCVVIRELGSDHLCDYYNAGFTRINKDRLGYEILEGQEYKIYQKVLKAIKFHPDYGTRFKSISFAGKQCTVEIREIFSGETKGKFTFKYSSKTTIKEIVDHLANCEYEGDI